MGGVTHLACALVFPVRDFILQLVSEDISEGQLAAIFEHGRKGVSDKQGGVLFVFAYFQLEVRFANIRCMTGR